MKEITKTQKEIILDLTSKGLSLRQLARIFETTANRIYYIVRWSGIKRKIEPSLGHCVICDKDNNLIDDRYYSVCEQCIKDLKNVK